ncbi:hypothetical protein K6119_03875 [Paracrocinitomix mangrovi]|uniref:hypothetical protein n=1 Tax=Paracrocinitomix mangrovi TaxID=2862509 RepID=UPI001C8E5870|nr:hypothetical protein [Paracrocinitomix mangrovi]UKN02650.1 hypothetical protein K6119_03875 [Paracrocinitomix mangrovi]
MTRLLYILFIAVTFISCSEKQNEDISQAQYTYQLKGWESLGKQTLVIMDAQNTSSMDQEITFQVEVINTDGKVFTKDTTIQFEQTEKSKDFQLVVDTEGEISEVKITSLG